MIQSQIGKELNYLRSILENFWANYPIHCSKDHVNLDEVFNDFKSGVKDITSFNSYSIFLRNLLHSLKDGHLVLKLDSAASTRVHASGLSFLASGNEIFLSNISNTKYGNIKIRPDTGDLLIKIDNLDIQSYLNTFNLLPGSTPGHRLAKLISSLSFQERFQEEVDLPGKFTMKKKNESIYDLDIIWTDTRKIIRPDKLRIKEIKKGVFYLPIESFNFRDCLNNVNDLIFIESLKVFTGIFKRADVIIIDLRNNSGGSNIQAQSVACLIIDKPIKWMCYRHKTADPKKSSNKIYTDILKPGKFITAYLKNAKIWFIVGYRTYSTSEVLLNALIEFKNISIAGQLTGGGAGNPKIFKLPFSGFEINIPVTEIYKPYNLAETIETNPVVPDKIIDQSIEDYHEGKDTVLKYLLESV